MTIGIRSTLLKSAIVLTLFYLGASIVAFFFMMPATLQAWLEERDLRPPEAGTISALDAGLYAYDVVVERLGVVFTIVGAIVLAAVLSATIIALIHHGIARARRRARGNYRGISASIGVIPVPPSIKRAKDSRFSRKAGPKAWTREHYAVMDDLIGYLKAHKNSYAGPGHGVGIFQHTLGVIDEALRLVREKDADPLLPLAAAAHDIGKIKTFIKLGAHWYTTQHHDKVSARVLATLPSWWAMESNERRLLVFAVKHEHAPDNRPNDIAGLGPGEMNRLDRLIEQLREVDGLTTEKEKKRLLSRLEIKDVAMRAFRSVVPVAPFQSPGLPKGVSAIGWREGRRLYLIEHRIRDEAMATLDADTRAALDGTFRARGKMAPYTVALVEALADHGWLVTEAHTGKDGDGEFRKAPKHNPLWVIQSGDKEFNGVVIADVPEGQLEGQLPDQTAYKVWIKHPLESAGGQGRAYAQRNKPKGKDKAKNRPNNHSKGKNHPPKGQRAPDKHNGEAIEYDENDKKFDPSRISRMLKGKEPAKPPKDAKPTPDKEWKEAVKTDRKERATKKHRPTGRVPDRETLTGRKEPVKPAQQPQAETQTSPEKASDTADQPSAGKMSTDKASDTEAATNQPQADTKPDSGDSEKKAPPSGAISIKSRRKPAEEKPVLDEQEVPGGVLNLIKKS